MNKCVVLMPLSQYKKRDLYRHVETLELADPSLFEDAVITKNLCICTLKKENVDKDWMDLVLRSVDQRYIEYYKYNNVNYGKFLTFKFQNIAKTPEIGYLNIENIGLDKQLFIHRRCTHGLNRTSDNYAVKLREGLITIRDIKWQANQRAKNGGYVNYIFPLSSIILNNSKAKVNCGKWLDKTAMMSDIMAGLHTDGTTKFAWPQLDWSNIHINQKELWDKGDYDNAVLAEMHLKWEGDSLHKVYE